MTPADSNAKDPLWLEPQRIDEDTRALLHEIESKVLEAHLVQLEPPADGKPSLKPLHPPFEGCACERCAWFIERRRWEIRLFGIDPAPMLEPGKFVQFDRCDACDMLILSPDGEGICLQCRWVLGRFEPQNPLLARLGKKSFLHQPEWVGWLVLVLAGLALAGGVWLWWHLVAAAEGL